MNIDLMSNSIDARKIFLRTLLPVMIAMLIMWILQEQQRGKQKNELEECRKANQELKLRISEADMIREIQDNKSWIIDLNDKPIVVKPWPYKPREYSKEDYKILYEGCMEALKDELK
jgi:hypothetical protein